MIKKAITMFPALMLGLMIASCEKIEQPVILDEPIDFTTEMDAIPLQYGRLVSATSDSPYVTNLWFEQDDHTIVGVRINVSRNTVSKEVMTIKRN